jgi:hypothetical protein
MSFEAWSLPSGVDEPAAVPATGVAGGVAAGPGTSVPTADVLRLDVTPEWLEALTTHLRRARSKLLHRTAADLADTLGRAAERFLDPGDPLRAEALEFLPGTSGLSPEMSAAVLDGMSADWTRKHLMALLTVEFGTPSRLDDFTQGARGGVRAFGASLTTQIVAGSVPGVGATALLRSLLVKSPTLLKPGLGDVVLPVLLARAIRQEDPDLADALAVAYWPGDAEDLTASAVGPAGTVVVYGGDAAVASVRSRTPVTAQFMGYHHRVSVGLVGRDGLSDALVRETASEVAGAVAFFDQRGCVSPQMIYVEEGGDCDPAAFAAQVGEALTSIEIHLPGGVLGTEEASSLQQIRGTAEVLEASGSGVTVRHGGTASWTVVFDPRGELVMTCVGRTVHIIPVHGAEDVAQRLEPLSAHLQTVALTGCGDRVADLARDLAEVGVTRITYFDRAPFPPPWWHHDGQGPLQALVRWVDLDAEA